MFESYFGLALMHTVIFAFAIWIILTGQATAKELQFPDSLRTCPTVAYVAPDNDIRLEGDARPSGKIVKLPEVVKAAFYRKAITLLRTMQVDSTSAPTCHEFIPRAYRISEPSARYLYVGMMQCCYGGFFLLALYDPASGSVTRVPADVEARWSSPASWAMDLLRLPIVSNADLFRDNSQQIVFEERAHNGTMYNAAVYHYYEIGHSLELQQNFALETNLIDISQNDGRFDRKLKVLGKGRLRVDTFKVARANNRHRNRIGYVIFEANSSNKLFAVASHHLLQERERGPEFSKLLVTGCEESENDFLRDGCD